MAEHSKEAMAAADTILDMILSSLTKKKVTAIIDAEHTKLREEIKSLKRVIFGINKNKKTK